MEERRPSLISQRAWHHQHRALEHMRDHDNPDIQRTEFVLILDKHGFNWKVFLVAMSGFFTDSYTLFASNVILPALAFVYWEGKSNSQTTEIIINVLTLAGSCFGQLLFGFLADLLGRQRLYGVELVIVIFATLGFAASGPGYSHNGVTSMSITPWLMFWKFVIGIGIGAEYPLSAAITIEWAAKQSRARMMAAVFLMQPLGQLCAYAVGLAVLHGLNFPHGPYNFKQNDDGGMNPHIGIDVLWRIVTGVGCIPAVIALIFRWAIPESGRYTSDMKRDADKAYFDTRDGVRPLRSLISDIWRKRNRVPKGTKPQLSPSYVEAALSVRQEEHAIQLRDFAENEEPVIDSPNNETAARQLTIPQPAKLSAMAVSTERDNASDESINGGAEDQEQIWHQFNWNDLHWYFIRGGNWRYLVGACTCWFFLDLPFYGLGFNNPGTLAKLWTAHNVTVSETTPSWLLNSAAINLKHPSIFSALDHNGIEAIVTVSIWSLLGCALLIWRVNSIDRRRTLIITSILLSALLLATAIAFPHLFHKPGHSGLIVLFAIIQLFFGFGPNTLVFILVAEIFPTRYRCTAYGIAAASGKLGAVVVQLIYLYYAFKNPNSDTFGQIIYLFAASMAIVALAAWWYMPNVQKHIPVETIHGTRHVVENKALEDLGEGRDQEPEEEKVGIRKRTTTFANRIKGKLRRQEDD